MDMDTLRTLAASAYAQLDLFNACTAVCCLLAFFFVKPVVAWASLRFYLLKAGKQLPPGSMGLLWIGETLQFLHSLRYGGPHKFIRERTAKFRSLTFKTSLFLHPMVVVQGAAANRFLANGENRQDLRNSWPSFTFDLLGWNVPPAVHGAQHKRQRQIMSACLGPGALQKVVVRAGSITRSHMDTWWRDGERISVAGSVRDCTFHVAYSLLLGAQEEEVLKDMRQLFRKWWAGLAGVPLNLPGTGYRRAKIAGETLQRKIDRVIQDRQQQLLAMQGDSRGQGRQYTEDLLAQFLVARDENGCALTLEELRDVTLFLLFAGHDTAATTLTFALKFLEENAACHERLVEEHRAIAAHKKPGETINWVDITNMKYTWAVLQETMRLRPPAFGGVKETLKEVHYNGYTIPKGWKILYTTAATHENDEYFKHSSKFDPSRFELDKIQKEGPPPLSFVAFGLGPHACKGIDFARMTMSLYLHHLIMANHKWTSLEPNEKYCCLPMLTFAKGYPVLVSAYNKSFE